MLSTPTQNREKQMMLTPHRRQNTCDLGKLATFTTKTQVESFRANRLKRKLTSEAVIIQECNTREESEATLKSTLLNQSDTKS